MAGEPLVAVLRYHEVALKGRNRPLFVTQLQAHVRRVLAGLPVGPVARSQARLLVPLRDAAAWPEVRTRLARVFGIANIAPAVPVALPRLADPEAALAPLAAAILRQLGDRPVTSFRVVTKRSDKLFPIQSPDVSAWLGARVKAATGGAVDLSPAAAVTITVDVLPGQAFASVERVAGAGGLPVGTSGRVLALLSGGIDSPVAAWRMMRRGCRVDFVHFHSAPFVDRTSVDKAAALARTLVPWQLEASLWLVPFFEVQRQIVAATGRPLRVVLYRRMMLRIAEALAVAHGAQGLVTGESLGQVASQTLANLAVIGEVATLPVLRPLVGMDKGEIMAEAERIGTFATSIVPDQDCCTLFAPAHPATRAARADVLAAEARYDVAGLVRLALDGAERLGFRFPERPAPRAAAAAS